jgi:hypothetical protein
MVDYHPCFGCLWWIITLILAARWLIAPIFHPQCTPTIEFRVASGVLGTMFGLMSTCPQLQVQYKRPPNPGHGFPTPGWEFSYQFTNFSTEPIAASVWALPKSWTTVCSNLDGGVKKKGLPDRQNGYLCVSPGADAHFTLVR